MGRRITRYPQERNKKMYSKTLLITSLTGLCMIGAGKTLVNKPRPTHQTPPAAHTDQDPVSRAGEVALTSLLITNGLARPVQVVAAPGDYSRIFIVEQRSGSTGRVKIYDLENGVLLSTPFLSQSVSTSSEQGLLGLAFHPNYNQNGYLYINYTNTSGNTVIERLTVSASNPNVVQSGSDYTIMTISQPYTNHNGGWLGFGPDGYLYIATGDGGSGGDPGNRAQDITNQMLGKMLRIDVDGGSPYVSPPSNPFVGVTGDDEIWAYGLRNAWRCSFDRETGDLWMADVGQNAYEEISFQPANSQGGENYGWRCYEGDHTYNTSGCSGPYEFPIWEYGHGSGCSITGGHVYRGEAMPSMHGTYFFSDYCTSRLWTLRYDGAGVYDYQDRTSEIGGNISSVSGYGEDAAGEIYICDLGGEVWKVIPEAPAGACCVGASSCVNIPQANCDAGGGTWMGKGTTCASGACDAPACPTDINGDGIVNVSDILSVIAGWGPCEGCDADVNDDGVINVNDLLEVVANWGPCE